MVVAKPSPRPVLPASRVVVRAARRGDHVADLVFEAAPPAYTAVAGSEARARAAIEQLWRMPGHSASFEHALVAESGGRLVGVMIGFRRATATDFIWLCCAKGFDSSARAAGRFSSPRCHT